jgi:Cu2+-exporting ATPase
LDLCSKDKTEQYENDPKVNKECDKKKADATAVAYQCPMKCEGDKTYDKPGKCPKCKMDLKKMEKKKSFKR